mmetsp:Transcript_12908/g.24387  ORF Transcript_12908/g.24387 Transcript_12908/m.24387 type:complete len:680 (+) Transcript_12908:125-2164(+)
MQAAFLSGLAACLLVFVPALWLDDSGSKEYPVSKVVKLLEDMKKQLQDEADADEEVYDKLACWCETNDKAKTKAISDAEARINELTSKILQLVAGSEQLKVEIQSLQKEIAADKKALAEATALREKQAAEFNDEEKEMIQSIKALDAAIVVLSKHHSVDGAALMSVMATVKTQMQKHADLLLGTITPHEKRVIMSFTQRQSDYFDSAPTFKQAYKPQSGEVFGILKQMKETFESDLSQDQKDELSAQQTFGELKTAKELEISTGEGVFEQKLELLASTDENAAQAKEDRDDTSAALSADEKFLLELKNKCSMTDQEWEERQKTRQKEMEAVSQAITILHSDDARDLFSKVFNPTSLLQERRVMDHQSARQRAAATLLAAGARHHEPKLTALAVQARLDAFTQVKKAIDDMVEDLLREKGEEVKLKAFCVDEFAKKERGTAAKTHSKADTESKIKGLESKISTLEDEIKALNAEIADLDDQMLKASQARTAENAEFDSLVAEQREAQALLASALKALEDVYKTPLLMQKHKQITSGSQAPPPDFATYKKSGAAPPVIELIQHIISNAKEMENEAMAAEAAAQDAYTKFKQVSMDAKQAKQQSVIDKTAVKAQAEQDLIERNNELDSIKGDLSLLASDTANLHKQCDYTLNNFDVRQQARDQEIEALRQAKAYLSGLNVNE